MSDTSILRVWQGWRNAAFDNGAGGWQRFLDELGERFIPETWRVMTRFSLQAYVPGILVPSEDGLPEEVAVLVYASADDYEAHKSDPEGKAYGAMHPEVFNFQKGPKRSRTATLERDFDKLRHRPDSSQKAAFESSQGQVHFLAVKAQQVPEVGELMKALALLPGELVVLREPGYALIWLVTAQALRQQDVVSHLTPLMVDLQVGTWQVAQRQSLSEGQGVTVHDKLSLHFQGTRRPLGQALKQHLKGWRDDIPSRWKPVLEGVEPDLSAIPPGLFLEADERIHPLRKRHQDPAAPVGSHLFKALDSVAPEQVRAVLVGQDPYPNIADATGRSFEQGALQSWGQVPTRSLRRITQALAAHRWPELGWDASDADWDRCQAAFEAGSPGLQRPGDLFDHWGRQGVLCLNLGLTLSRFDKKVPQRPPAQAAHMAMWTPVIRQILTRLVQRADHELLLLLWGGPAQEAVDQMDLPAIAAGTGDRNRLVMVRKPHPAYNGTAPRAIPFLGAPNVFSDANQALKDARFKVIDW